MEPEVRINIIGTMDSCLKSTRVQYRLHKIKEKAFRLEKLRRKTYNIHVTHSNELYSSNAIALCSLASNILTL